MTHKEAVWCRVALMGSAVLIGSTVLAGCGDTSSRSAVKDLSHATGFVSMRDELGDPEDGGIDIVRASMRLNRGRFTILIRTAKPVSDYTIAYGYNAAFGAIITVGGDDDSWDVTATRYGPHNDIDTMDPVPAGETECEVTEPGDFVSKHPHPCRVRFNGRRVRIVFEAEVLGYHGGGLKVGFGSAGFHEGDGAPNDEDIEFPLRPA